MPLISGDPLLRQTFNAGSFRWDEAMNENWVKTVQQVNEIELRLKNLLAGGDVSVLGHVLFSKNNLSDLQDVALARGHLEVYSKSEIDDLMGSGATASDVAATGPQGQSLTVQQYLDIVYAMAQTSDGGDTGGGTEGGLPLTGGTLSGKLLIESASGHDHLALSRPVSGENHGFEVHVDSANRRVVFEAFGDTDTYVFDRPIEGTIATAAPAAPQNVAAVQDADAVIVTFNAATEAVDEYHIAAASGTGTFRTVHVVDAALDPLPTTYLHRVQGLGAHSFRVHSVRTGVLSAPVARTVTVVGSGDHALPDASILSTTWGNRTAELHYALPESPHGGLDGRLSHVEVRVWSGSAAEEVATTEGDRLAASSLLYEGRARTIEWQIPVPDRAKGHQFWVLPVTRTVA